MSGHEKGFGAICRGERYSDLVVDGCAFWELEAVGAQSSTEEDILRIALRPDFNFFAIFRQIDQVLPTPRLLRARLVLHLPQTPRLIAANVNSSLAGSVRAACPFREVSVGRTKVEVPVDTRHFALF